MENFDRENIDELLEIRQIRQYFPPAKICAVRYVYWTPNDLYSGTSVYLGPATVGVILLLY